MLGVVKQPERKQHAATVNSMKVFFEHEGISIFRSADQNLLGGWMRMGVFSGCFSGSFAHGDRCWEVPFPDRVLGLQMAFKRMVNRADPKYLQVTGMILQVGIAPNRSLLSKGFWMSQISLLGSFRFESRRQMDPRPSLRQPEKCDEWIPSIKTNTFLPPENRPVQKRKCIIFQPFICTGDLSVLWREFKN